MSYEVVELDRNRMSIRCTPRGVIIHIHEVEPGVYTVTPDEQHRSFTNLDLALQCAREIGHDPDVSIH